MNFQWIYWLLINFCKINVYRLISRILRCSESSIMDLALNFHLSFSFLITKSWNILTCETYCWSPNSGNRWLSETSPSKINCCFGWRKNRNLRPKCSSSLPWKMDVKIREDFSYSLELKFNFKFDVRILGQIFRSKFVWFSCKA